MECLFGLAVSCTKMSLLILTRRIMSSGTGILRHIASAGMFVVACEGIIFILVVIFTCRYGKNEPPLFSHWRFSYRPASAYWTLSFAPQKCINERLHLLIGGIINTLTDFLVFFLPLPIVSQLKMHRRQRTLLCLLFGAGFVVCLAGTVRIYYTWKTTSTFDKTWLSFGLFITTVIELDLGIVRDETLLP